jgi:phage shock protein A
MSIISRLFKMGEAKANKVMDGLEKPELMLEQAIRDKDKQIKDAKKSVQACIATERQTKALLEREKADKTTWAKKAEAALKAGKEELAVKALTRSSDHEKKAVSLETNWKSQRTSVDTLKQEIFKLEDELAEFKRNKDFIIAQSKASETKKQIYEAKAKIQKGNGADDLMARMKAKAERSAFEADAAKEMAETYGGGDSLEKEFESMGEVSADEEVQKKLAALKEKLGKG